jgi:hypothetical protein
MPNKNDKNKDNFNKNVRNINKNVGDITTIEKTNSNSFNLHQHSSRRIKGKTIIKFYFLLKKIF